METPYYAYLHPHYTNSYKLQHRLHTNLRAGYNPASSLPLPGATCPARPPVLYNTLTHQPQIKLYKTLYAQAGACPSLGLRREGGPWPMGL